jgi:hypothetical protein
LSENFRYTGIIEVVGALIDINLISKENMIPTMMFHGDCDRTVPYATAAHRYCPCNASGWLMMFGSKSIFDKMIDLGGTAILVTQCGGNHMTVNGIMERNASLIAEFVKSASTGKRMQMQTSEKYSSTGPKNNVCPICE